MMIQTRWNSQGVAAKMTSSSATPQRRPNSFRHGIAAKPRRFRRPSCFYVMWRCCRGNALLSVARSAVGAAVTEVPCCSAQPAPLYYGAHGMFALECKVSSGGPAFAMLKCRGQ